MPGKRDKCAKKMQGKKRSILVTKIIFKSTCTTLDKNYLNMCKLNLRCLNEHIWSLARLKINNGEYLRGKQGLL